MNPLDIIILGLIWGFWIPFICLIIWLVFDDDFYRWKEKRQLKKKYSKKNKKKEINEKIKRQVKKEKEQINIRF